MTFISFLLLFFNFQIAYIITDNETKNEKSSFLYKTLTFILVFFVWPMLILDKYYKK